MKRPLDIKEVPEVLLSVQRYLYRARDCEFAGDWWRGYNSAVLATERAIRQIQESR